MLGDNEDDFSSDSQDLEGTGDEGDDFSNEEADDALAQEGEGELEAELEGEEQAEEAQDETEEEEVENRSEKPVPIKFKDKNGNFDWKQINAVLKGTDLQNSFLEAQKTTGKALEERKELEKKYTELEARYQEGSQFFGTIEQLYETNPQVQAVINAALGFNKNQGQQGFQQYGQQQNQMDLPEGAHPNDPLLPVLKQLKGQVEHLSNYHQRLAAKEQQAAREQAFRQGLSEAKQTFKLLVQREPTQDEENKISQKMKAAGYLKGAEFVPFLFQDEIKKAGSTNHRDLTKQKRSLMTNGKSVTPPAKTSKRPQTLEEAFEEQLKAEKIRW